MEGINLRSRDKAVSYKETITKKSTKSTKSAVAATRPSTNTSIKNIQSKSTVTSERKPLNKSTSNSLTSNSRLSVSSTASRSTPCNPNDKLSNKRTSIQPISYSRLGNSNTKKSETIPESRLTAIEVRLELENKEHRQIIEQLKSDIERVQFAVSDLCDLQSQLDESRQCSRKLSGENAELRATVSELQSESTSLRSLCAEIKVDLDSLKSELKRSTEEKLSLGNGLSTQQQEVNSNIVIRGIDLDNTPDESEAAGVYKNICAHLGIDNSVDFEPVSVKILQPRNLSNKTKSAKTIQVRQKDNFFK